MKISSTRSSALPFGRMSRAVPSVAVIEADLVEHLPLTFCDGPPAIEKRRVLMLPSEPSGGSAERRKWTARTEPWTPEPGGFRAPSGVGPFLQSGSTPPVTEFLTEVDFQ